MGEPVLLNFTKNYCVFLHKIHTKTKNNAASCQKGPDSVQKSVNFVRKVPKSVPTETCSMCGDAGWHKKQPKNGGKNASNATLIPAFLLYFLGKPRGIRTARKHVNHRRNQRWADKDYKKAHLGTRWKSNPFAGASHAKGIVLEKV